MPYETVRLETLRTMVAELEKSIYIPVADLKVTAWVTEEPVPYAERTSGDRKELAPGDRWGKLWDCAWFHFAGRVPQDVKGEKVVLLIDVNGELCLVDEEGTPVQGLTNINSEFDYTLGLPGKRVVHIADPADGDETIDLWADAGCNDLFGHYRSGTLKEAVVARCRENVRQLYYDAEVLLETAEQLPAESVRRARILYALYEASLLLTDVADDERVEAARRMLAAELGMRGGDPVLTISAVGHAHIDLAWLWPIRETIRKGARTFSTALRMLERYPDYVFGASQPQLYDWMKTHYPKLYESVKERVREGRWEPQGAMWVESDTNVPGGESLVRQLLYGKRFFKDEFGMDISTLWMPDVFGYTASLPQILKKSGVDYMMTQKLSWSLYNRHPHHTFHWEGIDGSRVLTHMPPEDTYNSPAAPRSVAKAERDYLDKAVSDRCLMLFGIGDGGGGPGEEHLERLAREKNLLGLSPVVQEPSQKFFERLREREERYQTWRGELYLEKHQGTLTSQARNKRYNRKLEKALRELEFASVAAMLSSGKPYPAEELERIWKEVLLYQFHDILPGSSIKRVYDESLARYEVLEARVEELIREAYGAAAGGERSEGEEQTDVAFNSLPWEREEWIDTGGTWTKVKVPPMGGARIPTVTAASAGAEAVSVSAERLTIENDLIAIRLGGGGAILSILDKEAGREVLEPGRLGNELLVYRDGGDAWDFRPDYRKTGSTPLTLESVEPYGDGPKGGLILSYRYGGSTVRQAVTLTAGSRRIDFATEADWRDGGTMLRTSFPVAVRSDSASCEIQFGYLRRPTHRNTSWEHAKDEICAHHWIDLSEPDYGVALLNDSKYGHRAESGELDLHLLRSTSYPAEQGDLGHHSFTYSLYPHPGDHIRAEVFKRGYELNVPLRKLRLPAKAADASGIVGRTLLRPDHPGIMVETVKLAEEGGDVVVRLYETAGTRARTRLETGFDADEVWLADLMERQEERLETEGRSVDLAFAPFEIKTLRFVGVSL